MGAMKPAEDNAKCAYTGHACCGKDVAGDDGVAHKVIVNSKQSASDQAEDNEANDICRAPTEEKLRDLDERDNTTTASSLYTCTAQARR
jgi:hypothetical protein